MEVVINLTLREVLNLSYRSFPFYDHLPCAKNFFLDYGPEDVLSKFPELRASSKYNPQAKIYPGISRYGEYTSYWRWFLFSFALPRDHSALLKLHEEYKNLKGFFGGLGS